MAEFDNFPSKSIDEETADFNSEVYKRRDRIISEKRLRIGDALAFYLHYSCTFRKIPPLCGLYGENTEESPPYAVFEGIKTSFLHLSLQNECSDECQNFFIRYMLSIHPKINENVWSKTTQNEFINDSMWVSAEEYFDPKDKILRKGKNSEQPVNQYYFRYSFVDVIKEKFFSENKYISKQYKGRQTYTLFELCSQKKHVIRSLFHLGQNDRLDLFRMKCNCPISKEFVLNKHIDMYKKAIIFAKDMVGEINKSTDTLKKLDMILFKDVIDIYECMSMKQKKNGDDWECRMLFLRFFVSESTVLFGKNNVPEKQIDFSCLKEAVKVSRSKNRHLSTKILMKKKNDLKIFAEVADICFKKLSSLALISAIQKADEIRSQTKQKKALHVGTIMKFVEARDRLFMDSFLDSNLIVLKKKHKNAKQMEKPKEEKVEVEIEIENQQALAAADFKECVICLSAPLEIACVPCGHLSLCEKCYSEKNNNLSKQLETCPICRAPVQLMMKIFF